MAKTTSEIIAENQIKQKEIEAVTASRDAIHQKQMAEIGEQSAARTQAVLDGTSDKLVKNSESTAMTSTVSYAAIVKSPLIVGLGGFFLGALVMCVYFKIKMKRVKADYETRINEARSALDRMLKIASKE